VRIATWNVNSLRVRLPQLLDWLSLSNPDVVALQETKSRMRIFRTPSSPRPAITAPSVARRLQRCGAAGAYGATELWSTFPTHRSAAARAGRHFGALRVVDLYVPNGQSVGSEKYEYKLRWLAALELWLAQELVRHPHLVVLGDFNIAPEDRDVHDPDAWAGSVLVSEPNVWHCAGCRRSGSSMCFASSSSPQTASAVGLRAAAFAATTVCALISFWPRCRSRHIAPPARSTGATTRRTRLRPHAGYGVFGI